MPDYRLPELENPDILQSYLRGRMAPGILQEQEQQIQGNQLNLDQTRQALAFRQQAANMAQQEYQQSQQGGTDSAAPDASNDSWDVGKILGVDVKQSNLASLAREHMGVAQGMNPIEAHQKEQKARMDLLSTKVLDPSNPKNPIPTLINFANMPEGNAAALKANPGLFAQWEQRAKQYGVDPAAIYSNDPAVADKAVRQVAHAMAYPVLAQIGKEGLLKSPEDPTAPPEITPYQKEELALRRRGLDLQERSARDGAKPPVPPSGYEADPARPGALRPIPGGPQDPNAKNAPQRAPTEAENKVADLYLDIVDAEKTIRKLTAEKATDSGSRFQAALGSAPARFVGANTLQSDSFRKYEAAGQRWAANILYIKSGATANTEEVKSTWKQYFPQPGEGKAVVEQKAEARKQAIANIATVYKLKNPLEEGGGASGVWGKAVRVGQ